MPNLLGVLRTLKLVIVLCRMESTGKPGKVHISEATYHFLKEDYHVEEAEVLEGLFLSVLQI